MAERCTFGVQDKDGAVCLYQDALIRTDVATFGSYHNMSILVMDWSSKWVACDCPLPTWDEVMAHGDITLHSKWYCRHGVGWYLYGFMSDSAGNVKMDWRRQNDPQGDR